MFSAYAYIKAKELQLPDKPWFGNVRAATHILSALALVWSFWFELSYDKFAYNGYHAYVSCVPILAFIFLRNATPLLRSVSSSLFTFIGQCSLETFILQFHGWLASDTKAILLVLPATKWRAVNIVVSTIAFVWLSHRVAGATGDITEWMVGKKKSLPMPVTAVAGVVEGSADGAQSGVPESIPLMGQEKDGETGHSVSQRLTVLMQFTARSTKSSSSSGNAVVNIFGKIRDMADKSNAVKLGLVLLGLWVLNWVY
jgi:hypothetical protein